MLVAATVLTINCPSYSATYDLAVDVPTLLGGVNYTPNQIAHWTGTTYALQASLAPEVAISSLHRRPDGTWRFSPAHSVDLGGVTYEARDVVAWNGTTYAMDLDGSAVGVPADARIDALFMDTTGKRILSFDVPVRLGVTDYLPSDLVEWDGSFSLFWSGAAHGVPAGSNVVGADRTTTGLLVLTFDVPTRLGSVDYLPGQFVSWNGSEFASWSVDGAWPPSSQVSDFSLLPASGAVPDGGGVSGTPVRINKAGGSNLTLTWGVSCGGSDTDYEVYEGTIGGTFSNHAVRLCTTAGATSSTLLPGTGNQYYLVVPRNAVSEGSYGVRGNGTERPTSPAACLHQEIGACP